MTIEEMVVHLKGHPRKMKFIAYAALIVFGGFFCLGLMLISFVPEGLDAEGRWTLRILSVIATALWIFALLEIRKSLSSWDKIIEAIVNSPDKIVWVYKGITVFHKSDAEFTNWQRLFIHLIDGTADSFTLRKPEAVAILKYLSEHLPKISLGWSDELQKTYKANPKLLLERPQRSDQVRKFPYRYVY